MSAEPSKWPVSQAPVAIVGNVNLDIRTAPIPASADVFEDGETSVGAIYESIGGGGANTALAAARLGGSIHFIGCVGRDPLGRRLRRHLERFGVTTHLVDKAAPTGRSIALTWHTQHRHFLSCLPSSAQLEEHDIDLDALTRQGCRCLYRADIWFAPRMLAGGNDALLRRARESGMETSVDLNWDPHWNSNDQGAIARRIAAARAMLKNVSVVHGNERELCRFSGADVLDLAVESILRDGAQTVIAHRGPHGSAAFTKSGESVAAPARPVVAPKNQTGTGDAFTAAFLLMPHLSMAERLAAANDIAASHLEGSADLMPALATLTRSAAGSRPSSRAE